MFQLKFTISQTIKSSLASIDSDRQIIIGLPIDLTVLASLRETARLRAAHHSTYIEGNRLTQDEVRDVVLGKTVPGRERDVVEVRNYYRAASYVEELASSETSITERSIQTIHGLVMHGRPVPSPYRDGQNVILDSATGAIEYMPPEASDVKSFMSDLAAWIGERCQNGDLPGPILAGVVHYQFATIHPYFDGNGRTARLLATLILHKTGYSLKGIYSLDEYYAENLAAYYNALSVGPSHNYYLGRAEADVTQFLEYFCQGMASATSGVLRSAIAASSRNAHDQSSALRELEPRERQLLILFRGQAIVNTDQIATHLSLSKRTVVGLCRRWVQAGLLRIYNESRKGRLYSLTSEYEALVRDGTV